MVHRLLAAAIGADQVASTMLDKDHIVSVASSTEATVAAPPGVLPRRLL